MYQHLHILGEKFAGAESRVGEKIVGLEKLLDVEDRDLYTNNNQTIQMIKAKKKDDVNKEFW